MTLLEAKQLLRERNSSGEDECRIYLAAAFTPLHYDTFLAANLQRRNVDVSIRIEKGLYGDVEGNLSRMNESGAAFGVIHLEWADLDPRLGIRQLGGWTQSVLADVLEVVRTRLEGLAERIAQASMHVTVVLPTLPLPPLALQRPDEVGAWECRLRLLLANFVCRIADRRNVSILHPNVVEATSPLLARYDVSLELKAGYPYTLRHADALASAVAGVVMPRAPLKGLITDLDNTLWEGILGDDGVAALHWDLDRGSQMHGVYQQFLAALSDAGVLIAVASKNDKSLAVEAFNRSDMLLRQDRIFPVEVGWNAKSESIGRILKAWNVLAEDVAFVDDSPLELAEVQAAFPEMLCLKFPFGDASKIYSLLGELRQLFGRRGRTEEDKLRLDSLRKGAELEVRVRAASATGRDFLESVEATISLSWLTGASLSRAFELVNKTNQFNLNGRRFTHASWATFFEASDSFGMSAAYRDKFGDLGTVAVLLGRVKETHVQVVSWVLSCRAFSRRIEHRLLRELFRRFPGKELLLDFEPTGRNGPLIEFLEMLLRTTPSGPFGLSEAAFEAECPALHHTLAPEEGVTQT